MTARAESQTVNARSISLKNVIELDTLVWWGAGSDSGLALMDTLVGTAAMQRMETLTDGGLSEGIPG